MAAAMALAIFAAGLAACSATKAVFKGASATEVGTDGWWKASVSVGEIEAVRSTQRVVLSAGPGADAFSIKIDPRSLAFVTPPWGGKLVSAETTGVNGEVRVYRIPPGHSWSDVHAWYVKWFDFKPAK